MLGQQKQERMKYQMRFFETLAYNQHLLVEHMFFLEKNDIPMEFTACSKKMSLTLNLADSIADICQAIDSIEQEALLNPKSEAAGIKKNLLGVNNDQIQAPFFADLEEVKEELLKGDGKLLVESCIAASKGKDLYHTMEQFCLEIGNDVQIPSGYAVQTEMQVLEFSEKLIKYKPA